MSKDDKKIIWGPHQTDFLRCGRRYVGLFGGLGNGKTLAACYKCIMLATNYPDNLILIGRLTYPELRDSTKEVFMWLLRQIYPETHYTHNKAENAIEFPNGSKVIFRHLDNPANLLSINLGGFYIDQAEEIDEVAFQTLQGRLRRANIPVRQGLVTGNPAGHNWLYTKFGLEHAPLDAITPSLESHVRWDYTYKDEETKQQTTYSMLTATTLANARNLPPEYIADLRSSYGPEMFARYVLGSWSAFEGQIFDIAKVKPYETLPQMAMILTAIDPAISQADDACNTALVTVGVGLDGFIYDIETLAGKWPFLEQVQILKNQVERHKSKYVGVEDVAYQRALYEAAKAELKGINVVDLKADRDKFRRAQKVTTIIDKGLFRTNNKQLLSEMTAFRPDAKGKERKDRVDALVHALSMVQMYAPMIRQAEKPKVDPAQPQHFRDYMRLVKDQSKGIEEGDFEFEDYSGVPSYHNDEFF